MEELKKPQSIKTGRWMAILSASFGTVILLAFVISRIPELMLVGLFYIYIATIVNGLFFLFLLFECFSQKKHWQKIGATMLLMLLNIPLCLSYCALALNLNF